MNSIEQPTEGFYRMRLVRGGPLVGIRIWFGPPLEPWTREEMDRAPRWNAEVNNLHAEFDRVWPACMRERIDEDEYRFLTDRCGWARMWDGFDPMGQPTKRVNWDDASPPSFGEAA
jgi:hypothetical protein